MAKQARVKKEKETLIDKKLKGYLPFVIGLAVLALIFVVLYFAFQNLGKVTYEGLTFTKEKYGEVNRIEKEIEDLDTKWLTWIVVNRNFFWT